MPVLEEDGRSKPIVNKASYSEKELYPTLDSAGCGGTSRWPNFFGTVCT
jgi:hypothetical protein